MALDFGKLNFSTSFNPTSAFPLDARYYFESKDAAIAAAATAEEVGSSNTTYYFGETVVVIEENKATLYLIQKKLVGVGGELVEVGSKTLGDEKTIILEDGVLSLKDFGKYYYKYIAEESGVPAHYEKTEGFKSGLQPQITSESGELVLAWYEPNPTTVEGLATRISAVETQVNDVAARVDVVEDDIEEIKATTYEVELPGTTIEVGQQTAEYLGETINGVKATGNVSGSATITATDGTVTSEGKFTPAGTVDVTLAQTETDITSTGSVTAEGIVSKPSITATASTTDMFAVAGVTVSIPDQTGLDEDDDDFECLVFSNATTAAPSITATASLDTAPQFTGSAVNVSVAGKYDKATVQSAAFTGTEDDVSVEGSYRKVNEGSTTVTAQNVELTVGAIVVPSATLTTATKSISGVVNAGTYDVDKKE